MLIATGTTGFDAGLATPLSPLVDRPFLQHVIECLVDRGIKYVDILLHHDAEKVEKYFADGRRWGATFRYHLVRDPRTVHDRVARLVGRDSEIDGSYDSDPFLLVHADRLEPGAWKEAKPTDRSTVAFVYAESTSTTGELHPCELHHWSGAAWLTAETARSVCQQAKQSGADFGSELMKTAKSDGRLVETRKPLDGRTFQGLIESQSRVLQEEFPELIRFPGGADKGIWIQRNVALHRDVRIEPPVYIGPHCEIEGHTTLGPNVVISSSCHIHAKCEIKESLIGHDSMLGEGLSVENCVIDKHHLYHIKHDVSVAIHDDLLIGSTAIGLPGLVFFRRALSRLVAMVALLITWPLLLVVAAIQKLRCGTGFYYETVSRLPLTSRRSADTFERLRIASRRNQNESNFRHFLLEVLPGLLNVAKGDMGWVGVTPLSPARLHDLPQEWRAPYETCDGGLINEAKVLYGDREMNDEVLSAEVFHAVTIKTMWRRIKTIARYFVTIFTGPKSLGSRASRLPSATSGAMVR